MTTRLCDGLGARLGNFQGWAGKLRNTIVGTQITKRGPYQLVPDNHFNCAHTLHRPSTQKTHCIAEVCFRVRSASIKQVRYNLVGFAAEVSIGPRALF